MYRELLDKVTQAANVFHALGVDRRRRLVRAAEPPETHYAIWGGQAAGIVNAVNLCSSPATLRTS